MYTPIYQLYLSALWAYVPKRNQHGDVRNYSFRPQMLRILPRSATSARLFHTSRKAFNEVFNSSEVERPEDDVDVCIVGGGPAGLSAAIRLKQLEKEKGKEIRVVVLEKGSEVGTCFLS